ncbi:ankyrin repeat domain-containing protein [Bacillus cereus]|uniref:ankyrin repeat domain-containing protein n=1 Tax=Bacillus cereus TaxID=1396 RepID=UPI003CFF7EA0
MELYKDDEKSLIKEKKEILNVNGDLIRKFIDSAEFLGLQKAKPDKLFFTHLQAPGFSIQLEGENPDKMTGAMIDISYESKNASMGRGIIASLLSLLLNEEDKRQASLWVDKQLVEAERSLKKGIKPEETQLKVDKLILDFFPPTTLDNLNATLLIFATDTKEELKESVNLAPKDKKERSSKEEASLIEPDSSPNSVDDYGVTKLARASGEGNIDLVKQLLKQGADPNLYEGHGEPPLIWAARSSKDNVVKILLEAGANPNVKSAGGITPLMIAKEEGANVTIKYLLEHGAEE